MTQSSLEHGRIAIKLFHCRVLRGAVLFNKMIKKIHWSLNCFVSGNRKKPQSIKNKQPRTLLTS